MQNMFVKNGWLSVLFFHILKSPGIPLVFNIQCDLYQLRETNEKQTRLELQRDVSMMDTSTFISKSIVEAFSYMCFDKSKTNKHYPDCNIYLE